MRRGLEVLPVDHENRNAATVQATPLDGLLEALPHTEIAKALLQLLDVPRIALRVDLDALPSHVLGDTVDRGAHDPGATIGPLQHLPIAADGIVAVGSRAQLVPRRDSDTSLQVLERVRGPRASGLNTNAGLVDHAAYSWCDQLVAMSMEIV
jgi:hypothetical protein